MPVSIIRSRAMSLCLSGSNFLQMVIEAEKTGISFYNCLSEVTESTQARKLFASIEQQKRKMCETWSVPRTQPMVAIQQEMPNSEFDKGLHDFIAGRTFTDEETCRQMARNSRDEGEAARLAVNFEKEIILFLYEIRPFVPEIDQGTVSRLFEEEYKQLRSLQALEQNRGD